MPPPLGSHFCLTCIKRISFSLLKRTGSLLLSENASWKQWLGFFSALKQDVDSSAVVFSFRWTLSVSVACLSPFALSHSSACSDISGSKITSHSSTHTNSAGFRDTHFLQPVIDTSKVLRAAPWKCPVSTLESPTPSLPGTALFY